MANYYELLKVDPSASGAEIETAIETQYNQWRRLVTHHDPNVVDQANRTLRDLEQIRATLSDPVKRAAYDVGIGISSQIGGLADPDVFLSGAAPASPLLPQKSTSMVSATQRADAWVCPSCATVNLLKVRFCSRCGRMLGLDCPNCGSVIKADTAFCPDCGIKIEDMIRQKEAAAEAQKIQEIETANQWKAQTLDRARRNGVNPVVTVLIASGTYKQSFDMVIDQIENTVLRRNRFRVHFSDFKKGIIYATLQNTNIELHGYIRQTNSNEVMLIIACSGRVLLGGDLAGAAVNALVDRLTREHHARSIG